jgi:hypothetical protein
MTVAPAGRVVQFRAVTDKRTTEARSRSWRGWREALSLVVWPPHLKRTVATALVVGTILFAINQLNVVLDGHATAVVWIKTGATYLVPFAVANVGILIATHAAGANLAGEGIGDAIMAGRRASMTLGRWSGVSRTVSDDRAYLPTRHAHEVDPLRAHSPLPPTLVTQRPPGRC